MPLLVAPRHPAGSLSLTAVLRFPVTLVIAAVLLALIVPHRALARVPASKPEPKRVRVTVPFEPLRNHGAPIIDIAFKDGVIGHFMVDTGAAFSCMTDTFARTLHLQAGPANFKGNPLHMGSDGGVQSQYVQVDAMQVGNVTLTDAPFVLIRQSDFLRFGETEVDGLLGENVLSQGALFIDFPRRSLTMLLPGGLSDAEIASLGMDGSAKVSLRRYSTGRLPIGPDSNEFLTDLHLRKGDRTATEEVIVDTGAGDTSIGQAPAEALDLQALGKHGASTMGNGSVYASIARVPEIRVGDLTLTDTLVTYPGRDHVSQIPPLLGEDVLGCCRVLFDFPKDRLYLKPILPPLNAAALTTHLVPTHSDFTRLRDIAGDLPTPAMSAAQLDSLEQGQIAPSDPTNSGGDTETRVAALRTQLKGDPATDAPLYMQIGTILQRSGEAAPAMEALQRAAALYRTLVRAKPDDPPLLERLSNALARSGSTSDAEAYAQKAIALAPNDAAAELALGFALHTESLLKLTGELRSPDVSPQNLAPFAALVNRLKASMPDRATIDDAQSLSQAAANAFNRATELAPNSATVFRERADFLADRALGVTGVIDALDGYNVDVTRLIYSDARVSDIERVADLEPENVAAVRTAAETAFSAPVLRNEAGIDLREGKLWNSVPASTRARVSRQLDRLEALGKGADLQRASAALEALGYLELNLVQDRARAQAYLSRALALNPDRAQAAWDLGSLLAENRDYAQIISAFQAAAGAGGRAAVVDRLWLCYADAKLAKWDDALANAEAALAASPHSTIANLYVARISLEQIDTQTSQRLAHADSCLSCVERSLPSNAAPTDAARIRLVRSLYAAMALQPDTARTLALQNLQANPQDTDARGVLASLSE